MRHLTLGEVVALHWAVIESTGGATGLRDLAALESAVAQPRVTFDGVDPSPDHHWQGCRAGVLSRPEPPIRGRQQASRPRRHGSVLALNGLQLRADVDEQETLFLNLASGRSSRPELQAWLEQHTTPRDR